MAKKFVLRGKDELIAKLKTFQADVETGAATVLKGHANDVKTAMKKTIPTGSGKPSAPGMVPFSQKTREKRAGESGKNKAKITVYDLKNSIKAMLFKPELGKEIIARIYVRFPGSNAFYGHMLEYGRKGMAARPFFWPTINKMKDNAEKQLKKTVEKAANKWRIS